MYLNQNLVCRDSGSVWSACLKQVLVAHLSYLLLRVSAIVNPLKASA